MYRKVIVRFERLSKCEHACHSPPAVPALAAIIARSLRLVLQSYLFDSPVYALLSQSVVIPNDEIVRK